MTYKRLSNPVSCIECKVEFNTKGLFSHFSKTHIKDTKLYPFVCCIECRVEKTPRGIFAHYFISHTKEGKEKTDKGSKEKTDKGSKEKQDYQSNPNTCEVCNKILKFKQRKYPTCSRRCGGVRSNRIRVENGYKITEEMRESSRKSALATHAKIKEKKKFTPIMQCKICNIFFESKHRTTCSIHCLKIAQSNAGRKAAAAVKRRSKQEIILFNLCESHYTHVTNNEPIFNGWDADILIHDNKTAILWNGPWHYKEMGFGTHSLSQVQNRDRIKIKEITTAGWTPMIFEDREYTPETAFEYLINQTQRI